jgi:prepilin-type N-terminal cleavage/methylation domain-containing protein
MRRGAFTLIELMIVVLIIAILLAIAVPQWIRSRELSRYRACISNLRLIDNAKEQYAMDQNRNNGDPCAMADIWPTYIKGTAAPICPSGGNYTVNNVGTAPTCSYNLAPYPHVL